MIADQTGSLSGMRRHDYYPFGEENFAGATIRTAANGYQADNVRQKFTGKERDNETGLDYFLARYHSSAQGRFTSVDPGNAGAVPEDPQSWNGYAYARSNPVLYTDPDGRRYIVCGPRGGGSCGLVTDLEFNLDRDGLEAQGLQFTGGREFFAGGSIIYEGEVQATYQQISIDDRAKELAYWMQVEFRSVSMYERALVNGVFAGILGLRFGRGGNRGANFIQEITSRYGIFQCKECARELLTELRKNGIKARVLKVESKVDGRNIFSDKVGRNISENGNHWAIEVDGKVFDNIHKQGIPFEQWVKDFHSPGGVRIFTDITNEILK